MSITWDINPATLIALLTQFALLIVTIDRARRESKVADDKAEKAAKAAADTQRELDAFKLEAARRFVTDEMLAKVEERIVSAIDRLADRLDRIIEGRAGRGTKPGN